jgi:nitroimidazol reductase NimA-like FMN-containing flavoprotein (pyridoxamine 5'-phosphate oxidase superfamily)
VTDNAHDHAEMEILSSDECFRLLGSVPVGRIAFVADGRLQIFPVTFAVTGKRIALRSAVGSKLDAAEMARDVAFEADQWRDEDRSGWSVMAEGRVRAVTDEDRIAALEQVELEPWLAGTDMRWIEIVVSDISGRRLPG